jgi:hypothetical protein
MTQRTITAGPTPTVIIRAGADITVEGVEGERVLAETPGRSGLQLGRRSENQFARLRAKIGDTVLVDWRADWPARRGQDANVDPNAVEVQVGGSGRVQVPFGSSVRLYTGRSAELSNVRGRVSVYSGRDASLRGVGTLVNASSGGALDIDCEAVEGDQLKLAAGRDLRLFVRTLDSARILVNDLGGGWEGRIGDGRVTLRLKAGGDVTLVTPHEVLAQGPDFVLGRIEKPAASSPPFPDREGGRGG